MLQPDRVRAKRRAELIDAIAADAAARDADGRFPAAAFSALAAAGMVAHPPLEQARIVELLRLLADVGRGDLSVGRIYEGHVNSLLLIGSYGTARQIEHFNGVAAGNGLFGVWNTDMPDDPLRLEGGRLLGKKNFSSGVDGLAHAIVTVPDRDRRRMIVVPLDGLPVDRT